jgi:CheY-like chemotaxis protein/nitrogen-specific signal transduction histidine kinase
VAVLFTDITARKRDEAALRQLASDLSTANRRKTEFLAILAHELRNPLAPIRSGLELMRLAGDNPETVARVREMMDRQLGHLIHLVDDLLDIARITGNKLELKKQRVDLKSLVKSAVETSQPLIEGGGHAFSIALPDDDLFLDVDPIRISQVIGNLLNNAAKYTPPGGLITLSAFRQEGDAVIAVTDTGIGIPEDALAAVFEMFTQVGRSTHAVHGGLGIGLSLVRRLVEQHGGSVSAASPGPGKGSTFTVRLPLAVQGAASDAASGSGGWQGVEAPRRSLRVLVADDNRDAAATLAALLEQRGHTVRLAADGYEALELAREFQPDIAFLDIGMPGMNGYEVASAFRQLPLNDAVVLVAVTGWGSEEDRARSKAAGFNLHLTKPVAMAEIDHLLASMTTTLAPTLQ